jgi:hypothetical protein
MAFRVLPEYILEDIVDYLHFVVQSVISRLLTVVLKLLLQVIPGQV